MFTNILTGHLHRQWLAYKQVKYRLKRQIRGAFLQNMSASSES